MKKRCENLIRGRETHVRYSNAMRRTLSDAALSKLGDAAEQVKTSLSVHGGSSFTQYAGVQEEEGVESPRREIWTPKGSRRARVAVADTEADSQTIELSNKASSSSDPDSLPKLPKPHANQRRQQRFGIVLVFGASAFGATLSEVAARFIAPGVSTRVPATLAYVAAAVAISCLTIILNTTSHLIERTAESTTPIPSEVADALRGIVDLNGRAAEMPQRNIDGNDGRTYCVRCHVWRPVGVSTHHCRVCGRCSIHFDHHCHILGRCIAGDGSARGPDRGNLLPFRLLLAATAVGGFSCIVTLLLGGLSLLMPDRANDEDSDEAPTTTAGIAANWPHSTRMAVGFGFFGGVIAVMCFGLKIIGRMCAGAKELSERSKVQQVHSEHSLAEPPTAPSSPVLSVTPGGDRGGTDEGAPRRGLSSLSTSVI